VQSRGDSDTLALPAGTKSVQEPEASVGSSTVAARGHIDELCIGPNRTLATSSIRTLKLSQ